MQATGGAAPSSSRVLDRAAEILQPFPPSKNRSRPGDWTCPSCGFSDFQRRKVKIFHEKSETRFAKVYSQLREGAQLEIPWVTQITDIPPHMMAPHHHMSHHGGHGMGHGRGME